MSEVITQGQYERGRHVIPFEWHEADSFEALDPDQVTDIYAVPIYEEQVVLVKYGPQGFSFPGGQIEPGETYEAALKREIKEETNMRVVDWLPIGYQKTYQPNRLVTYSLRAVARVEPDGEFIHDPGGIVNGNVYVERNDVNSYTQYGRSGQQIVDRACEVHKNLQS